MRRPTPLLLIRSPFATKPPSPSPLLFHRRKDKPLLDPTLISSTLRSCADPALGRKLHGRVVVGEFVSHVVLCNHLINMYGKCGMLSDAQMVFDGMGERNLFSWNNLIGCYCKVGLVEGARKLFDGMPGRDSVSWNIMVSGYDRFGPHKEAVEVFVGMRRSGCCVDRFGVSSVVSACGRVGFLRFGKQMHGFCVRSGLDSEVQVGSAFVELYGKCSEIVDSRKVFDGMALREQFTWNSMLASYLRCSRVDEAILFIREMPNRNLVSWTTIVAGCTQHDRNEEAMLFFYEMLQFSLNLDEVSLVSVLSACIGLLDLEEGCKIHGRIVKIGFENDVFVTSALVTLYAKCGSLLDAKTVADNTPYVDDFSWSVLITEYAKHGMIGCACELFQGLKFKSLSLWNALITSYTEAGLYLNAFTAFKDMCSYDVTGDEFTFGCLLKSSCELGIKLGKQLHLKSIKVGSDSSLFVSSALIDMYSWFSEWEAAKQVFHSITKPNIILWNALICGYGQSNMSLEALTSFHLMMASETRPDAITLSSVLDSCSSSYILTKGMQLHALAHKMAFVSNVAVGSAILSMYGRCEDLGHAFLAFSDIKRNNVVSWTALLGCYVRCRMWSFASKVFYTIPDKNIVTWNTMLSGHVKHGSSLEAVILYCEMTKSGTFPDDRSFVSVLAACCNLSLDEQGKQIHGHVVKTGFHMNAFVQVALNDMYQKLRKPQERKQPHSICTLNEQGKFQDAYECLAISRNI